MKRIYLILLLGVSAFLGSSIYAQEFSITADLRARGEYNNGLGSTATPSNPAAFITERARLGLFYNNKNEKLKFGLVLQDVRTWGATGQIQIGDYNNFFMHEAYADILFTDYFSMKVGRQELNYDDARILGNLDWLMQARAHDVVLLKYENPKLFTLHVGGGYNVLGTSLTQQAYVFPSTVSNGGSASTSNWKTMQFLWLHKDFSEKFNLSFLVLNNGVERSYIDQSGTLQKNTKIDFTQTIGFRTTSFFSKVGIGWNANLYYQTGKISSAAVSRNLDAWNALAELYYTIKGFKVLAGFEFLSGNKTDNLTGTGTSHAFNPLYGTNHKFNGYMDFFYVGGRYFNRFGLWDPYVTLSYGASKWNIGLTGHIFSAAADIISNGNKLDSYLGTELDLTAEYKLTNWISFQGGFSTMFASNTLAATGISVNSKNFNHWAFLGVVIKPTLFKHTFNKS